MNSILIDERLGFSRRRNKRNPRLAIIPPFSPVLGKTLSENGYEVRFALIYKQELLNKNLEVLLSYGKYILFVNPSSFVNRLLLKIWLMTKEEDIFVV